MENKVNGVDVGFILAIARFLGPNMLFISMLFTSYAYYQTTISEAPTWRNVAAGSMALVATLAGLGYRDFVGKVKKAEVLQQVERDRISAELKHDRERRDRQHTTNVAAIVALAMAMSDHLKAEDKDKIQEIIKELLASKS